MSGDGPCTPLPEAGTNVKCSRGTIGCYGVHLGAQPSDVVGAFEKTCAVLEPLSPRDRGRVIGAVCILLEIDL